MRKEFGVNSGQVTLVVHAGFRSFKDQSRVDALKLAVAEAVAEIWPQLKQSLSAPLAVSRLVELLENNPCCNAGYGGVVQQDGQARFTASLMDGAKKKFSAVMLASYIRNPSKLALALQERRESIRGGIGVDLLARELGIAPEIVVSPAIAERWLRELNNENSVSLQTGTVGAVALDTKGQLAAATSTGGNVIDTPGRISDSGTVAGNYASAHAGVSCTGVGEEIVNDGLAVRLEGRIRDGLSLSEASEKCFEEAKALQRNYGWISLDRTGAWGLCTMGEGMPSAVISEGMKEPLIFD